MLPYIRRALGPAQLQAERVRLELTRPIGPAVFGTASSSSRIRSTSGGAGSNRLLGGHSPALYLVSYAPGGSRSASIRRPPAYEAGALPV